MRTILGILVAALLVAGCAGATGSAAPAASPPAPSVAVASPNGEAGVVQFKLDGLPATTTIDAVADGATVSGTAVTQFGSGTHTVRLGCAGRNGDTWAVAGKTEKTTVSGERAGDWSAVIVKDGSPQRIGIWLSDDPSTTSDCKAWLAAIDFATIGAENFSAVESGTLVPPPGLAP